MLVFCWGLLDNHFEIHYYLKYKVDIYNLKSIKKSRKFQNLRTKSRKMIFGKKMIRPILLIGQGRRVMKSWK